MNVLMLASIQTAGVPSVPPAGADFYIANDGNDANDGASSDTPWASLSKIAGVGANKTIALKKNGTWRETLQASAAGQIIVAYGAGAAPRITAADVLAASGWTQPGGSDTVYVSDSFNRSNGAVGSADGGSDSNKAWVAINNSYVVVSNHLEVNGTWILGRLRQSTAHAIATSPISAKFEVKQSATWDYAYNGAVLHSTSDPANNLYQAVYHKQTSSFFIEKLLSGGTDWNVSTTFGSNADNVKIRLYIEQDGANVIVKGKIWNGGDAEPSEWTLTHTDTTSVFSSFYGGLIIGVDGTQSNTQFEDFEVSNGGSLASYENTYQKALTTDPGDVVLEDGVLMTKAASIAAVDATEASFYWASNVLYVHATGDGDPTSNGKTYETPIRTNAADLGAHDDVTVTGVTLDGAVAKAAVGSGANQRVQNSTLKNSKTGGSDLSGAGAGATGTTFSKLFGTFERVSNTGYVRTGNTYTLDDPAIEVLRVETGVGDDPTSDNNVYSLYRPTKHGIHQALGYFGSDPWWSDRLTMAEKVGSRLTRDVLAPSLITPTTDGVYDWSRPDTLFDRYEAQGLDLVMCLHTASPQRWTGSADQTFVPGNGDETDTDFTTWVGKYVTFVTAFMARYGARFVSNGWKFETGNEINEQYFWSRVAGSPTPTADADQQRVWVNAINAAIKSAQPTLKVGICGIAGLGASGGAYGSGRTFLQHLLDDSGGVSNYDAVSIHPYDQDAPDVDTPFQYNFTDIALIRADLVARGLSAKEIWATEWGWYGLSDGSTKDAYTADALDMFRELYPYVTHATYFFDKDDANYVHGGLFNSDNSEKTLAEVFAKKITPNVHYKGTDYSFPKYQRTTGLDASSTLT